MFEEIKSTLMEELDVDEALITPDAEFVNDLKLNSLELADLVVLCEDKFEIATRKAYLHEAIKDLLKEGKITCYEYGTDELNPYITAIDDLEQDLANYKYYSVWHNVDVFALKGLDSSWGNPGRATIEDDGYGTKYVVTTYGGVKLYYSSMGVGTLPLIDGCTYAILVD